MLKPFLAGLALACFVTPALAGDCSEQAAHLLAGVAKASRPVLADFAVKGAPYDREVIIGYGAGIEALWFFAKGCLVGNPVLLRPHVMELDPAPPAAPEPAAPPAARAPGLEVGA